MVKKAEFDELIIGMKVNDQPSDELPYIITEIIDDKVVYKKPNDPIGFYQRKSQVNSNGVCCGLWYEDNQITLF